MKEAERVIARLPFYDEEPCSCCGDDTIVLVILGRRERILLCSRCCGIAKRQMNGVDDGLDMKV